MIKSHISKMTRGWFIGDFEPSIVRSKDFEVGLLFHPKGQCWPAHYHMIATEHNVLISGKMTLNGELLEKGDIFSILPSEIAKAEFLEDCTILCVKVPSIIGDKYEVET